MTGRVVFNPYAVANMSAPPPPGHNWLYPFNVWPQRFSQKAGPWSAPYFACFYAARLELLLHPCTILIMSVQAAELRRDKTI